MQIIKNEELCKEINFLIKYIYDYSGKLIVIDVI